LQNIIVKSKEELGTNITQIYRLANVSETKNNRLVATG